MVSGRSLLKDRVKRTVLTRFARADLGPDAYLPSERELAERLGISRTTIRAALADLESEGVLVRERGRGTRVVVGKAAQVGTVGVVFGSPSGAREGVVLAELFALIEGVSLALGSKGIPAIFCPASGYVSEAMATDAATRSTTFAQQVMRRCSAAILVEWQHSVDVARKLDKEAFPYVVANEEENADVRSVRVDFAGVGRQAAEYIMRCGYKRVKGLVGSRRRFVFREFCKSFEREWRGKALQWIECHHDVESARDGLKAALARSRKVEAVFAFGDGRTLGALRAMNEKGLAAPDDVGLMCYGRNGPAVREADVTGFNQPAVDVGRAAVEKLVDICAGRPAERQTILPAPLVQGRTMFF